MNTQALADKLTSLLKEGQFETIYNDLFDHEKVAHIEPQSPHFPHLVGVKAIREKDAQMSAQIAEVQELKVGEAIVSKDFFAIPYRISFTTKNSDTVTLDELIVYQVADGKIIAEQFFY
ncbi:MAG: SnoaL-like domain-containing protein [Thermonemataceae bacterium]